MPASPAICAMFTDVTPCAATNAAVASSVASRTARRCASMVVSQSLGITGVYATQLSIQVDSMNTECLDKGMPRSEEVFMAGSPTGAPRWVKLFGLAALAAFAAVVVMHLTGHGFGGHMDSMRQ